MNKLVYLALLLPLVYSYSLPNDAPSPLRMMDWEQFYELYRAGHILVFDNYDIQAADNESTRQYNDNKAYVERYLDDKRDLREKLLKRIDNENRLPDGSYYHDVSLSDGTRQRVILNGEKQIYSELAEWMRNADTFGNHYSMYSSFYSNLPADYVRNFPNPRELTERDFERIKEMNIRFARDYNDIIRLLDPHPLPPAGYTSKCDEEKYTGPNHSDRTQSSCSSSSNGLRSLVDFPLYYYTTCIKNQRARGSCVAFATIAAAESIIAVRRGVWTNLGEQHLYSKAKLNWFFSGNYGDGLPTIGTVKYITDNNYYFAPESMWEYNPSTMRIDNKTAQFYSQSCVGYSGMCSDTNHQAGQICSCIKGFSCFCGYSNYFSPQSFTNLRLSEYYYLDYSDISTALAWARLALLVKMPVVAAIYVDNNWDSPVGGYVRNNAQTYVRGSHAVEMVGWIDNSQLPASVTPGDGGGYFIIKNSWGCYGDAGYAYVPHSWAVNNVIAMIVVSDVYGTV